MAYLIFISLLISYTSVNIQAQCITSNDIIVNETSIGVTVRNLIDGSTGFSLDLLRTLTMGQKLDKDSSGVFFSPYSIWSALLVTYMGARGATEQEMRNVLGLGDADKITVWEAFRNIRNSNFYRSDSYLQSLFDKPPSDSYQSANRIYFQDGTTFKECMKELLEEDIAFVDFSTKAEEARETINQYVEEQTQNRIKDLVPVNAISPLTKMVVANAVYFKETWQNQFDPEKTAKKRFTTPSRRDIFVKMMNTRGRFLFGRSAELDCQALELPYSGNALSMMILLPRNRYSGIDILSGNLTPQRLKRLLNDMYPRDVRVQVPKFKMEDSFELSPVLYKMGLRTLFDNRRVDLSGFTGEKEFSVDAVLHKTFIDVNEEGTEAAAATAIVSSRSAKELETAYFVADYPFIYFIKDNLSNSILFLGTVKKPPEFGSD